MKHPETWFRWFKIKAKSHLRHSPQYKVFYALFAVVAVMGAYQHFESTPKYFTSWKYSQWQLPHASSTRAPANAETCESPVVRLEDVQLENAKLLQSFPRKHGLQGRWLHLELSKLSFAEALFLSRLPEEPLRPFAVTLATCGSVPCIYDLLTQDSEKEIGTLAWNWFLKTGTVLVWKDQETFFSKEELKSLRQLASTLSADFFHQPQIVSFEKSVLPEGQCVRTASGKVKLSTLCAASDFSTSVITGFGFALLPQWLEKFPEFKQSLTASKGGHWQDKHWSEKKVDPKQLAPYLAKYVLGQEVPATLKNFFQDHLLKREWTLEGDMKREFKRDQWVWRDLKQRHLKDCVDLHKTALQKKASHRSIASLSEPHPLAQCLRLSAAPEFLLKKRSVLASSCEWNKPLPAGQVPTQEYLSHWENLISKDIDQLEWRMRADGPQWLREYQSKEASLASFDPTWVYFQCHNSDNPRSCYQQGFGDLLRQEGRAPSSVQEEILSEYPFESLDERVRDDVGMKRQWHLHRLEQETNRTWGHCWRQGPNEMVKIRALQWVSSGTEFLDGRFATCLESASQDIMAKLHPGNSPEARYWKKELEKPLKNIWKQRIADEAERERGWLIQQVDVIKNALSRDLRHLMSRGPGFDPQGSCLTRLTYHYPARLYFHDRTQLNGHLGKRVCREVLESEEMKRALTEHRGQRWKVLGSALQTSVLPKWEDRVRRYCLGRVPASQAQALLETEAMKGCIREQFQLAWPDASDEVSGRYDLPLGSLDEFKSDLELLTQNTLYQDLKK